MNREIAAEIPTPARFAQESSKFLSRGRFYEFFRVAYGPLTEFPLPECSTPEKRANWTGHCPKTVPTRWLQVADSIDAKLANIAAHKQMFLVL